MRVGFVQKILDLSGCVIINGLHWDVIKIVYKTTVLTGKKTIAILSIVLNVITTTFHKKSDNSIIETGGCLLSEYEPNCKAVKSTYVEKGQ